MNYYYIENEEQKGPVNFDELTTKSITENTLIWHEGLNDWTEAKYISSLESFFKKTTPPKIPVFNKEPPKFESPKTTNVQLPKKESNKRNTKMIAFISGGLVLLLIGIYFIVKSSDSQEYIEDDSEYASNNQPIYNKEDGGSTNYENSYQGSNTTQQNQQPKQQKPRQLTEDEIREDLFNREVSNPTNYLSADGTYRVNLAANTIVEGTIYNNASIAGFKNVKLVAKFYSKTDVLLGKESFLVMDFVDPSGSLPFRYKISGWWDNIDHWTLDVISAESY